MICLPVDSQNVHKVVKGIEVTSRRRKENGESCEPPENRRQEPRVRQLFLQTSLTAMFHAAGVSLSSRFSYVDLKNGVETSFNACCAVKSRRCPILE